MASTRGPIKALPFLETNLPNTSPTNKTNLKVPNLKFPLESQDILDAISQELKEKAANRDNNFKIPNDLGQSSDSKSHKRAKTAPNRKSWESALLLTSKYTIISPRELLYIESPNSKSKVKKYYNETCNYDDFKIISKTDSGLSINDSNMPINTKITDFSEGKNGNNSVESKIGVMKSDEIKIEELYKMNRHSLDELLDRSNMLFIHRKLSVCKEKSILCESQENGKIKTLRKEILNLKKVQFELKAENLDCNRKLQEKINEIETERGKVAEESKILEKEAIDKLKKYDELQNENINYQNIIKTLQIKLSDAQEQIINFSNIISSFEKENSFLKSRASLFPYFFDESPPNTQRSNTTPSSDLNHCLSTINSIEEIQVPNFSSEDFQDIKYYINKTSELEKTLIETQQKYDKLINKLKIQKRKCLEITKSAKIDKGKWEKEKIELICKNKELISIIEANIQSDKEIYKLDDNEKSIFRRRLIEQMQGNKSKLLKLKSGVVEAEDLKVMELKVLVNWLTKERDDMKDKLLASLVLK
ncbi:hypothetical protein SteCoe_33063 [Stentor coeruleus]|uniref:Uncharacterized protein n=1 Tax=Stentor coeruleus TaxID=5963 RepID=A0A1R2AXN6_9CILI|nr:hypothetical protein SteCoe_33063 [Stentor coeruleus]